MLQSSVFSGLQPAAVWSHFSRLCAIPRPSKGEAALRDALLAWAQAQGLAAEVDAAGNLIIRKPASPGCEQAAGVVLQAHLDMVCQKNAASSHDFSRDAIMPALKDGWLVAEETTLGADNGIGAALILAVLEDKQLVHGPLEALFTVDEEAGMGGARGLAGGLLQGRLMLNLDTEDWSEFYLGCAGGLDVDVRRHSDAEPCPVGASMVQIDLRGLRGGHSGVNIHEERGNANKLLVRVLQEIAAHLPFRLARLQGGTARNAIAREALAQIAILPDQVEHLATRLPEIQAQLRRELAGVDEGLSLSWAAIEPQPVLPLAEQKVWLASLHAAPYGVHRMSQQVPGVVESSNNLGIVEISAEGGSCNFMVRSLIDRAGIALAEEVVSLFSLSGSETVTSGFYPGWTPNPASPLLALCQRVFSRDFGGESKVKVVHAGLECGLIGEKYPGLDIVSFGPNIRGAHAPGERVEVASVENCWKLLASILAEIAK
ncbi:MAG: aminoacyl-histidine dipeptidase [Rhodocyclales bacterium]|nr:aminoacyl-histidine dipeptidase [Rhodocyclales bacterium]